MAGVGPGGALLVAPDDCEAALHSNIYVYLVNKGLTDVANALKNNGNLNFDEDIIAKANARRNAGDDNDGDSKDDNIRLRAQGNNTGAIDLLQWWTLFWDMHSAGQRRDGGGLAGQYLAHAARLRQSQQPNAAMMGNAMMNTYGRMMPNQMNIAKTAMANNTRMNGLPQNMRSAQPGNAGAMQKDGNDTEMAGQVRDSSPLGDGAAPSPKRQRMDGPGMQQQGGPNGIMPMVNGQLQANGGAPNASMLTASFDPNSMSPATNLKPGGTPQQRQYSQTLVNQSRANLERLAQSNPGMGTGSPMMAGADGQFMNADMFPGGQANPAMRGQMPANLPQNPNAQGGALADYQMQLMLLEQQNKRRLMMARQEQDVAGNPQLIGPPGLAPGMSPRQNSRTGQSPPDPSKRGTPKLGQDANLPEGARGSPIPGVMDPSQLPPGMGQQFFPMNGGMMRPGMPAGPMAATQIEIMRRNQQMNGQFVQGQMGGPMMQNQMMQGQADQRQSMPPPQAPPAQNAGRNGSPQQTPAPPTPSQANKAAPKGKKEAKEPKKKPPKKAVATTAATPTAEEGASDDVPPPTPSTPKNTASQLIKGTAPQMANVQPQPQMLAQNNVPNMPMAQNNNNSMVAVPFAGMTGDMDMNMTNFGDNSMLDPNAFGDGGLDLAGFDFDSFLEVPNDDNGLFAGVDFSGDLTGTNIEL